MEMMKVVDWLSSSTSKILLTIGRFQIGSCFYDELVAVVSGDGSKRSEPWWKV